MGLSLISRIFTMLYRFLKDTGFEIQVLFIYFFFCMNVVEDLTFLYTIPVRFFRIRYQIVVPLTECYFLTLCGRDGSKRTIQNTHTT